MFTGALGALWRVSAMAESLEKLSSGEDDRRDFIKSCGRFALTVPPAMTILLSTSLSSPAIAKSTGGRPKGNNGVGNGLDPQPRGNPPINDGPGSGPGHPGNRGGAHKKP